MKLKNKVFFVTLGCPKNEIISEKLASIAEKSHEITDSMEEADLFIINSCGFIEDALSQTIETTIELKQWIKKNGSSAKILLTGCAVVPFQADLSASLEEADLILNYQEYEKYFDYPDSYLAAQRKFFNPSPTYQYLSISEGCSKNCTYCIIPKIKGKFHPFPQDRIIAEASSLKENNIKELIIVSQDTLGYGKPLVSLAEKINRLNFPWIRFMYFNPDSWEDYFAKLFEIPSVLPYLEIPFQHLSDPVLRKMNRKSDYKKIERIVIKLKKRFPELFIRTTIITGFPGETIQDFDLLKSRLADLPIDLAGVFPYSDMNIAPSHKLKGKIPAREKIRRMNMLNDLLQEKHSRSMETRLNKQYDFLVEDIIKEKKVFKIMGRIPVQAPEIDGITSIENPVRHFDRYKPGDFLKIRLTDYLLNDYFAEEVIYDNT